MLRQYLYPSPAFLLLFLLSAFIANFASAQSVPGVLKGVVTSDEEGVEFAKVVVKKDSTFIQGTQTDENGRFAIPNLEPDNYIVTIKNGGMTKDFPVAIKAGLTFELKAELGNNGVNLKEISITAEKPKIEMDITTKSEGISIRGGRAELKRSKKGYTYAHDLNPIYNKSKRDAHALRPSKKLPGTLAPQDAPPKSPDVTKSTLDVSDSNGEDDWDDGEGDERSNDEAYEQIVEQDFILTSKESFSTFACDMDAAAYPNVRRMLQSNSLPPENAVRIEELINYFRYETYPPAAENQTLGVYGEIAPCPWNPQHRLAMIGVQAKKIDLSKAPPSNIVFLVDISGSMSDANKLPLVKSSLKMLLSSLRPIDKVSLVTYAGNVSVVLPPTSAAERMKIEQALDNLQSGGGTAGASGIHLAYQTAQSNFLKNGNNRVILCTDGDFNVGASSDEELVKIIEEKRKTGIYLSILGFGMGNYKDSKMEKLSNAGNGSHAYIDSESEASRALVKEFGGTMYAVANDVKMQTVFNPNIVEKYRLIGYDHRILKKEDFDNDAKDAGEMGSDAQVTALYEVVYKTNITSESIATDVKSSQRPSPIVFKIRYKNTLNESSQKIEFNLWDENKSINQTSTDFRFAAAVTTWGLALRNSKYKGSADGNLALSLAKNAKANHFENQSFRDEFVTLVNKYKVLKNEK